MHFIVILCAKPKHKVVCNYSVEGKWYKVLTGFRKHCFSLLFTIIHLYRKKSTQNSVRHGDCVMMLWKCFSSARIEKLGRVDGKIDETENSKILQEKCFTGCKGLHVGPKGHPLPEQGIYGRDLNVLIWHLRYYAKNNCGTSHCTSGIQGFVCEMMHLTMYHFHSFL